MAAFAAQLHIGWLNTQNLLSQIRTDGEKQTGTTIIHNDAATQFRDVLTSSQNASNLKQTRPWLRLESDLSLKSHFCRAHWRSEMAAAHSA